MKTETLWKQIPGYGDKYQISSCGDVINTVTGRVLKNVVNNQGYIRLNLSHNGIVKMHSVHRLVAEAFLPNPNNFPVVNHIDGNKANPSLCNLEWVSFSENTIHAFKTGLSKISDKCRQKSGEVAAANGSRTTSRKVCQMDISGTYIIQQFKSIKEAARYLNIPYQNISRACKFDLNAGGFKWKKV